MVRQHGVHLIDAPDSAAKTISIAPEKYGLKSVQATTLISGTSAAGTHVTIDRLTLPPYGAFIGAVK